jgi:hypothetical protein
VPSLQKRGFLCGEKKAADGGAAFFGPQCRAQSAYMAFLALAFADFLLLFVPDFLASMLKDEDVAEGITDCAAAGVEITTMGVARKAALMSAETIFFMVSSSKN